MRRKELEVTDPEDIEALIRKATVCHLGLVDGEEPYVIPVFFGYEKGALYFHSAGEGRKIELIKKNSRIAFEFSTDIELLPAEKPCQFSAKYRSVTGTGTAVILESTPDKIHGLSLIMRQYGNQSDAFAPAALEATTVIRIDIDSLTGKAKGY